MSGQSLAIVEQEYMAQMEVAAGRLGISQQWRDSQHQRNVEAQGRVYANRVSQVQPYQQQPVKPVDFYGPIFGIAQTAIDTSIRTGAFRSNPLATE